ncbi:division/outer membrane stress-associated lipid-binding lipoprotein [Pseudoalteromonas sp. MMG012]|uniref:division/outer membrane stress-associated lipid-binding lipoprotein n=1 Tax=Pseudoalteromonas sp. MMG012 TaxID=2822686 RepID=UPI001B3A74E3|nr:division/outer membrane stress-associated lipid-binding lipoprotein [Pseudoalteromonas sp. MMG012]MBQ4849579.1 divisome-associated lipoprotein YraP [Pseudoalteromonas sp. MMG012]
MRIKPIALLLSLTLLQGCAAAVVAGTASAMSAANDRRTIGTQIDDNNIEIKGTLAIKSIDRLSKHANISLVSVNGIVLMVGQVSNIEMQAEAENALKTIPAIRSVHNQLRIGTNIGLTTQTHDTWLTSKVKTKLLADENVSGNNIKVVTENSEVFLMGLVAPAEAEQAVEIARNISGVERVIKAFEYL